jgi:membrane protease YdiL (CAAX protease family)
MNPITSFVKRYPQAVFWGIAYAVNWGGWILYMLFPSDLWQFMIWGVALGGVLVTAIVDGRSGLRTYFSRIVRWRVGIQWYAVALLLPLVVRLAAFGLNVLTGAVMTSSFQLPAWPELVTGFLFIFFTISLGEEPGFRGFSLPRFLTVRTAVAASLIIGVLHAIWHLPLFVFAGDPPIIALLVIAGSFIFTWLFNNTKGSVLLAMLFHASVDIWTPIFNPLFTGADAQRQTIWLVVAYSAVAILLVVLTGKELGRKPEAATETITTVDQPLATE